MAGSTNPVLSGDLSVAQVRYPQGLCAGLSRQSWCLGPTSCLSPQGFGYTDTQAMDPSLQVDGSQLPAEAAAFPADVDASQSYIYGQIKRRSTHLDFSV